MKVSQFISEYNNHPVLFVGTGISLRYLKNSYTWDGLLSKIAEDVSGNSEFYLDIKSKYEENGKYKYEKIAGFLESKFNEILSADRNGKFKEINDQFYEKMAVGLNVSRFKLYIAHLLSGLTYRENIEDEIAELKKTRKNIGSIITTNYDRLVEEIFEFGPLIGNDILLSNPYGSVYKIHGCVTTPVKTIITEGDYDKFHMKYELVRAQLLSLFIHNPIIFLGYNIGDENIKNILKTIFTYIEPNSEDAKKIRKNFLLVEYEAGSENDEISEHDIDMEGFSTIRINKLKTDNFVEVYMSLSKLNLPISAMDVRKVQAIVKEIYSGGNIQVKITEDLDLLKNSDRIIAIGSSKTISYQYQTSSEVMSNYFKIIDEENDQLLLLINKYKIQTSQYFPVFGFGIICTGIEKIEELKAQQLKKIKLLEAATPAAAKKHHVSLTAILHDYSIPPTYKTNAIIWGLLTRKIDPAEAEVYLRSYDEKDDTNYRKLLCVYDYVKYAPDASGAGAPAPLAVAPPRAAPPMRRSPPPTRSEIE